VPNDTVTLSSKGQVVIPKPVRERLHLREGAALTITQQDGGVFLKPIKAATKPLAGWKPINPAGVSVPIEVLCQPVNLKLKPPPRKRRKA
jgi:AbrB family looped-hinge helix DNA binding protein